MPFWVSESRPDCDLTLWYAAGMTRAVGVRLARVPQDDDAQSVKVAGRICSGVKGRTDAGQGHQLVMEVSKIEQGDGRGRRTELELWIYSGSANRKGGYWKDGVRLSSGDLKVAFGPLEASWRQRLGKGIDRRRSVRTSKEGAPKNEENVGQDGTQHLPDA